MRRLPLLTASSARTFRRCAREYRNRYELGRVPRRAESGAQSFGTLVHHGLETWWRAVKIGDAIGAIAVDLAIDAVRRRVGDTDAFDVVRAEELLRAYDARWLTTTIAEYEVIDVEALFEAPLVNPDTGAASRTFQRAGKLDVIVRERVTERVLVVEHKTSSEAIDAGDTYWRRLTLDSQVSTYLEGAAALGVRVDACLYDVLGKPGLRPLKATPVEARRMKKDGTPYANQRNEDESPEEFRERLRTHLAEGIDRYFKRAEIVRLEDEAAEAAFDDWQTARAIRESQLADRWPRNTDACERFHRLCPYFSACIGTEPIDDDLYFRSELPHRELATSTATIQ